MSAAIHAVREGDMSCNKAAAMWEIPEATLRRYLKTDNEVGMVTINVHLPKRTI